GKGISRMAVKQVIYNIPGYLMMEESLQRVALLIGEDGINRLQNSTVLVVGIGGVGSYCVEALARSGIGNIILVDGDDIAPSNLNRQIHAVYDSIGKSKTEVMKERVLSYQKNCNIKTFDMFYNKEVNQKIFIEKIDFVVDAIDTISCKLDLIEICKEKDIPFISSLGMANRFDPTQIEITDLSKTEYDPLAKAMRTQVRKREIKGKIPVIFSKEHPFVQHQIIEEDALTRKEKMPPASMCFVPATAGLTCASYVVKKILENK
ncbi:MAG: tRNA threonylcarbamoyladenosine dehydratase, partial [Erysipelotrichaceae bacterium]